MTEIENNELLHQVYFEKYKNKEVKDALKVLASANKKISDKIKKTKIVASKARYKAISDELKTITAEAKADYEDTFEIEELLSEEMESQLSIIEKGIYADKQFRLPGTKQLKESVLFKPIEALNHRRFDETFNYFHENLYSVWDSAVRTGFLTGQSTADIVKTVMGSVTGIENDLKPNRMSQIRKSVENNTRTILQAFADEAHRAVFEENEDVIEGYKILATLDRRTCLLCGSLTSKVYKTVKDVPELPVHYSCRCVLIPVTKWDKEFPGKQASEFGEVDGDLTYEQWLASQPESIQKEILGSRFNFYNENKSLSRQFISDNNVISLKELKIKNDIPNAYLFKKQENPLSEEESLKVVNSERFNINNDLFEKGEPCDEGYIFNCINSVMAYEMRLRGEDVIATSAKNLTNEERKYWRTYFDGAEWKRVTNNPSNELNEIVKKIGNNARIEVYFKYKDENFSHVFMIRNSNGEIKWEDPQVGVTNPFDNFNDVVRPGSVEYARIDNLNPSMYVFKCCEVRK